MDRLDLPPRPRILVIALRRLGDVLLTTPLIASLRRAYPDATIDAMVFADTAGILHGNPDLSGIVTMPARRTLAQSAALAAKLWRRYDLSVSTQGGDRPTLFAILSGRRRASLVEDRLSGRMKARLLDRSISYVRGMHRVEEMLSIADMLGIARVPTVVPPRATSMPSPPAGAYAVIHATPMFRYKRWTEAGWRELAAALAARGLTVIASGGPSTDERGYLDRVWGEPGVAVRRVDGALDWGELAKLIGAARLFVGPDTSVTHLAAATGCPTVALFGPTDPRLWGPWPADGLEAMWQATGKIQRRGNVWLVQNAFPCTPCQLEGCERRLESDSACLTELTSGQVVEAIDQALGAGR